MSNCVKIVLHSLQVILFALGKMVLKNNKQREKRQGSERESDGQRGLAGKKQRPLEDGLSLNTS